MFCKLFQYVLAVNFHECLRLEQRYSASAVYPKRGHFVRPGKHPAHQQQSPWAAQNGVIDKKEERRAERLHRIFAAIGPAL